MPRASSALPLVFQRYLRPGNYSVILKVVKPGIRETLNRDAILLRFLGVVLPNITGGMLAEVETRLHEVESAVARIHGQVRSGNLRGPENR